ncbi:Asp-hemolysin [Aspergillus pseudotamarii]|uniref:Asp-hemolysin n=1 Tax=Aspergillus pseudotamarii TaxID=132259 RepID=A0A5N6T5A2_ASPPS|nr:Asp-hemolysin [Aspergillus pseudotamarii]KAE8141504.1 Asp-hemolysin [Aspergillus pseudotamarii]
MVSAQWVTVHLINRMSSDTLSIKNAILYDGKWYKDGNQDHEISYSDVNEKTAPPDGSVNVNSCGRSNAPSGTTGGFEIYDGETKIGNVHWDCPWGNRTNEFGVDEWNENYWVQIGSWSRVGGAIGTVDVEVGKKG